MKLWEIIKKINGFLDDTFFIWMPGLLILYWFAIPETRWIYPIAAVVLIVVLIISCPLFVLFAILFPFMWIAEKLLSKGSERLKREDCPHFNVDGKGQCNLLPEPEECEGYCRTLSVWGRE